MYLLNAHSWFTKLHAILISLQYEIIQFFLKISFKTIIIFQLKCNNIHLSSEFEQKIKTMHRYYLLNRNLLLCKYNIKWVNFF